MIIEFVNMPKSIYLYARRAAVVRLETAVASRWSSSNTCEYAVKGLDQENLEHNPCQREYEQYCNVLTIKHTYLVTKPPHRSFAHEYFKEISGLLDGPIHEKFIGKPLIKLLT